VDIEEVREQTLAAFAEAGITDPDISYITEDYIRNCTENGVQDTESFDYAGEGIEPPTSEGPESAPLACQVFFDCWFTARTFGGAFGDANGNCTSGWRLSRTWASRAYLGQCRNNVRHRWRVCFSE
jgi:hypothetical protein